MRTLKIGKKNYKLEFSFEAACDEECVEKTIELIDMVSINDSESAKKIAKLPKIVIELVKAGLISHNPVETEEDAREFVKQYFKDNPKESFMSLSGIIIECMGEDGFLQLIGLTDAVKTEVEQTDEKVAEFPMNTPED